MNPEPRLLESAFRRWWVVLIAFVATTLLTLLWVMPKPDVYESSGTYVVQPRGDQNPDSVRALEALIRGTQINATYALIARSAAIKDAAVARLASVPEGARLKLDAEAVTGTNALEISASARDNEAAHALAVAAGAETIAYVEGVAQPYELVMLDPPELPTHPVNSRKSLTVALGAMLGLMLGLGLAAILDRIALLRRGRESEVTPIDASALETARARVAVPSVRAATLAPPSNLAEIHAPDPPGVLAASGHAASAADPSSDLVADAASDPVVQEELVRAADGTSTYSLGILKLEPVETPAGNGSSKRTHENGRTSLGELARFVPLEEDRALPNGRPLTYVREGVFAAVLPDMSAATASKLLGEWLAEVASGDSGHPRAGLLVSMTVVEYSGRPTTEALEATTEK
jgi:capsular polysaccharide biosynthesis protein